MSGHAQWPVIWGEMPPFADHPGRACKTVDTDLFFAEGEGARKATAAAKAICSRCPIRDECAAWSIPQVALRGVWGGLAEPDRERARAGTTLPPKVTRPPTAEETERRIAAGRAAAAARTARTAAEIGDLAAVGLDVTHIMALTGHSRRTVHRYLKMLREQARPNGEVAA